MFIFKWEIIFFLIFNFFLFDRSIIQANPINFAFEVLRSFGGSLFLDHWEDRIKGRIIPDDKYKSWWESAKKKIRTDRRFVLPSKRNLPFELRDEDVSPAEALIGDFSESKDIKAKISVLEAMGKDLSVFEEPAIELEEILKSREVYNWYLNYLLLKIKDH